MGALVLEGGDASRLLKAEYLEVQPQVHIHFLTDDSEFAQTGHGKVEFVCHGCGAAQLVSYDRSKTKTSLLDVRNAFAAKHDKCENRDYAHNCPCYRSTFEHIDLRRLPRSRVV